MERGDREGGGQEEAMQCVSSPLPLHRTPQHDQKQYRPPRDIVLQLAAPYLCAPAWVKGCMRARERERVYQVCVCPVGSSLTTHVGDDAGRVGSVSAGGMCMQLMRARWLAVPRGTEMRSGEEGGQFLGGCCCFWPLPLVNLLLGHVPVDVGPTRVTSMGKSRVVWSTRRPDSGG